MSVNKFFEEISVPKNYNENIDLVKRFIAKCSETGRKLVLVSSGGTTVPLESRTVRFIDNFSVGTRGATSTEYFLSSGYAVIFLHRRGSLEPYKRHFTHTNFLDMVAMSGNSMQIKDSHQAKIHEIYTKYHQVQMEGTLLSVEFVTLHDYLYLLRGVSQALNVYTQNVVFYLAAAVSDFHIPASDMPEHKIQSSGGPLNLSLHLVPKLLQPLVSEWAPQAFVTSFKLETDDKLLIPKAREALEKYKHQVVIGNVLDTRKEEVVFVTQDNSNPIKLTGEEISAGVEIEKYIISELIKRHKQYQTTG